MRGLSSDFVAAAESTVSERAAPDPEKASSKEDSNFGISLAVTDIGNWLVKGRFTGGSDRDVGIAERRSMGLLGDFPFRSLTGAAGKSTALDAEAKSKLSSKVGSKENIAGVVAAEPGSLPRASSNSFTPAIAVCSTAGLVPIKSVGGRDRLTAPLLSGLLCGSSEPKTSSKESAGAVSSFMV